MGFTDYVLTLAIPVQVNAKTGHAMAMERAKEYLEDTGWRDGRHPFEREMFVRGLEEMLRNAAIEAVQKFMERKYGDERVEHKGGNGSSLRSYVETGNWAKDDFGPIQVRHDQMNVQIHKVI
jgi:hypothetical protein